ncbi:Abi family protein [Pelagibius sp.]|uniref:Abi family protein n=1 Tax=Pelagibius sp. TaxID=1931238 RepID=UPI00260EDA95|nr:Abi family protein [Pelagibius sp.]
MAERRVTREFFDKPALTIEEQVSLLKARGLVIPDPSRLSHYLNFISYYRFSGYFRYFYKDPKSKEPVFRQEVEFEDVLNLYIFDRKLRNLLMDALERIEIAVKAAISNSLSVTADPFWLSDPQHFDFGHHDKILVLIEDVLGDDPKNHHQQFISHFYRTYSGPHHPPGWMLMEVLSFASVSKIYQRLKGSYRVAVAKQFEVPHHSILESWLHALSFARNVCAHHQRVWNRSFTIQPKIPHSYSSDWPRSSNRTVYSVCAMTHHLLRVIADGSLWSNRLRELIDDRPKVSLEAMGFRDGWSETEFWSLEKPNN